MLQPQSCVRLPRRLMEVVGGGAYTWVICRLSWFPRRMVMRWGYRTWTEPCRHHDAVIVRQIQLGRVGRADGSYLEGYKKGDRFN
jgi:hypothetical protein